MTSIIHKLNNKKLIRPPNWLPDNVMFEGQTGSVSYGATGETSDIDIIGFCMPPRDVIFPHLTGQITGFGRQIQKFDQYQQHGINDVETKREYDITIYNVVKFFQLVMDNNPNMVDALFLPRRCVLHSTEVYEHVRNKRELFLHKGSYHKFRGYAMSQLNKIKNKQNPPNLKCQESIDKLGGTVPSLKELETELLRRGLSF